MVEEVCKGLSIAAQWPVASFLGLIAGGIAGYFIANRELAVVKAERDNLKSSLEGAEGELQRNKPNAEALLRDSATLAVYIQNSSITVLDPTITSLATDINARARQSVAANNAALEIVASMTATEAPDTASFTMRVGDD